MIKEYLDAHSLAWTDATKRSEESRLVKHFSAIVEGPEALWSTTQTLKPYSRKTLFLRARSFFDWQVEQGLITENPYKKWMKQNARLFKHVYTKATPSIDFKQAQEKISKIPCKETRRKATQLLEGGLRWRESFTIQDGQCLGKGEKPRTVFVDSCEYRYSYSTFVRLLARVGLKPHDLRKVRATDLARRGMREADLCKVFGWSNFATASSYIAPISDNEIKEMLQCQTKKIS